MDEQDFAKLLGARSIPRHYLSEDLEDYMAYARSE